MMALLIVSDNLDFSLANHRYWSTSPNFPLPNYTTIRYILYSGQINTVNISSDSQLFFTGCILHSYSSFSNSQLFCIMFVNNKPYTNDYEQ